MIEALIENLIVIIEDTIELVGIACFVACVLVWLI